GGIPPCHRSSHEDSFFVTGVVHDDYWASDSLGRIEVASRHAARDDGLRASWLVALLELWSGASRGLPVLFGRAGGRKTHT
ncbi:hypothetical protein, partial [Achromobacter aegrifaciens]|uniref:hypothetical protein n=1 Tax=Achromobacter aegrifaciens TaxID=1287736 RepID=UPI00320B78C7